MPLTRDFLAISAARSIESSVVPESLDSTIRASLLIPIRENGELVSAWPAAGAAR